MTPKTSCKRHPWSFSTHSWKNFLISDLSSLVNKNSQIYQIYLKKISCLLSARIWDIFEYHFLLTFNKNLKRANSILNQKYHFDAIIIFSKHLYTEINRRAFLWLSKIIKLITKICETGVWFYLNVNFVEMGIWSVSEARVEWKWFSVEKSAEDLCRI